jgi:hypothetical protein
VDILHVLESREVGFAGGQEDHSANLGEPALTARLARIPRRGNTQGRLKYLYKYVGQTGRRQVRCFTVARSIFNRDSYIVPMYV